MDEIKAFVGNLELIKSEMVHVTANNVLSISFQKILLLKFEFLSDNTNNKSYISNEILEDNKTLIIKCYNFDNSLGQGLLEPINIGIFNGKTLYIAFFVWTPDSENNRRLVNYSIYLEK